MVVLRFGYFSRQRFYLYIKIGAQKTYSGIFSGWHQCKVGVPPGMKPSTFKGIFFIKSLLIHRAAKI